MGTLPIPGDIFFTDFSDDKLVLNPLTCSAVRIETENYDGKPSLISVFF